MRFNPRKSWVTLSALIFSALIVSSFCLQAQEKPSLVKGIVQNNEGEPLAGVTVVIRKAQDNFTSGTSTDSAGIFTFSRIPPGGPYSFTFSAVGHEPQTMAGYNIKSAITLSLVVNMKRSGAASLDQVVVVGYGVQKRKDLTGSVGSISTKEIKDLGVTRIEQGLAGRVAGVQVKAVSGEPGSAPQIRIRGIGSISAGVSPLYVIDGFPTDNIQTLNPNDIESLDILKDASATAIYGSRGSNGVVIINTKRGKSGKPVLAFDTYYGVQRVSRIPKMKNSLEQAMFWLDGMRNKNMDDGNNVSGNPTTWKQPVPQIIMDVIEGRNTTDEEALDGILVDAPQQMYSLSSTLR